jgi:hypothetical protein
MIEVVIVSFTMTLISGLTMLWSYQSSVEDMRRPDKRENKVSELVR